jgi:hypothetical protein
VPRVHPGVKRRSEVVDREGDWNVTDPVSRCVRATAKAEAKVIHRLNGGGGGNIPPSLWFPHMAQQLVLPKGRVRIVGLQFSVLRSTCRTRGSR